MASMKKNSGLNKRIEEAVLDIEHLEATYNKRVVYAAARRYNDRIYNMTKHKKKKCRKKKK